MFLDTERFGHRHLEKMGWKPGAGLGSSTAKHAITSHVKISLKDDTLGLGAKTAIANQDANNWAPGLDSFQALLNRLNTDDSEKMETETVTSNTTTITSAPEQKTSIWESELKISQSYNRVGKWGSRVKFVMGEELGATITEDQVVIEDRKSEPMESKIRADEHRQNAASVKKRRKHKHCEDKEDPNRHSSKKHKRGDSEIPHSEKKRKRKMEKKSSKISKSKRTHSPESSCLSDLPASMPEQPHPVSEHKSKHKSKTACHDPSFDSQGVVDVEMSDATIKGIKRKMKSKKSDIGKGCEADRLTKKVKK